MTKPIVGGRPLLFENPEDLAAAIDEYFKKTDIKKITLTGLCLAIGTSKQVLADYEKREAYTDIVRWAKLVVENAYELSLRERGSAGDIFALKNFGWSDKQDINLSGHMTNDVAALGIIAVPDSAALSKATEALRAWQQQKKQLSEKQADAEASPSPLEKLPQEMQSESRQPSGNQNPTRKQW